jgi:GWxTD domain-containing protein
MKIILLILSLSPIVFCSNICPAGADTTAVDFYNFGYYALAKNDTAKAEYLFERSVDEDKTAPALFELSKILISKKTIRDRARARELLQTAIYKDPKNIEYRLLMAALMEYFSSGLAFKQYEDILDIDSANATALFQMGRIKEEIFDDYNKSVTRDNDDSPILSLDDYAMGYFKESEFYFKKLLSIDSTNSQAILHLSALYESADQPGKAIPYLVRLTKINPNSKNAYLYLGLMYYETSNMDSAYYAYKNALILMNEMERRDFTFYSVKELIKPLFGNDFDNFTDPELEALINLYWKVKNPLYLSKYNERLLEHYSRVAYADLHFTWGKSEEPGWKTDRGEVVLRYGEPINRIRFRPQIGVSGDHITIKAKTDVWYYTDMVFGFSDEFFNGNFQFSQPVGSGSRIESQYAGDSFSYFNYVKRVRNETYNPKFEGPKFNVPYNIVQFKDPKESKTDLFVNYGLRFADSLSRRNNFVEHHIAGLFLFSNMFQLISEKRDSIPSLPLANKIDIDDTTSFVVNSLSINAPADSGNFAFEIERNADKGISSNHFKLDVRHFSRTNLAMSDIVLANDVDESNTNHYSLTRKNISLLPNPLSTFSDKNNIFIYYEIYNLTPDSNGICNIEQQLTIRKKDERSGINKALNSFLNIFSLGKDEPQVTLTSQYQFHDKSPQVYFQLDMNKYEPDDYLLTLSIKDKNSGKEIKEEKTFIWK